MSTIPVFNMKGPGYHPALPYNWAYMATEVVRTDIFLCGGYMHRIEGEWATRVLMKFCPNTMEVSRLSMMRERRNYISICYPLRLYLCYWREEPNPEVEQRGEVRHQPQPVVHGEVHAQDQV